MGDERSIYMWNHCLEVGLGELGKNIEGVPGIRTDAENDTLLHFARKLCSSTRMIEMLETATCSIDKSDVQCSIHVNDTHTDRNEIQNNFLDWELASVGIVLYCLAALPSLRPPAQLCRGAWRDKSSVVAVMEPLLALLDHPEVRLQREAAAALAACVTEAAPVSKAVPAAIVPSPASLSPALSKKPGRRSARDVRDDISSDSDSDENGDVQPPSLSQEQEATHAALLVLDRERQRQRQQWLLHHLTASLLPRIQRAMQRQTSTRTAFLSAPSTATRVGGAKESEDLTFIPLDDTTGWGNLESLIQAYYDCIFAAGRTGAWRFVTDELACKLLVEQTAEHINRHVRELALRRWGQLCELLAEPCLETEPEQTRAAPTTSLIEEEAADYWLYYGSMVGDLVEMNGSISADSPAPVSEVTALSTTLPTTLVSPRGVSGAAPPAAAAAAQAFDAYRQRTAGAPIRVVSSGTDGNQLRLSTVTTRDDGTGRVATVVRHEERPTVGTISRPLGTLAKSSTTNNNTIANMFIKTDASSPPLQRAGMQMRIHRPMTSDSWLRPAVPCAALMAKALRAGLQDEWGECLQIV